MYRRTNKKATGLGILAGVLFGALVTYAGFGTGIKLLDRTLCYFALPGALVVLLVPGMRQPVLTRSVVLLVLAGNILTYAIIFGGLAWRRWSKVVQPANQCSSCGYNLTGNVSGACPECGTVIEHEIKANDASTPPKMKKALIAIGMTAIIISLLAGRLLRVDVRETVFVDLYGLSRTADATHIVEVGATDGTVWFREEEPGFSLGCCDPERLIVQPFPSGGFAVILVVNEICMNDLEEWSRDRFRETVGLVVDDEVVLAVTLHGPLRDRIAISIFGTQKEAEEFLTRIESEGFEELP